MDDSISVVVNTLNEEENLPWALRSVQGWATEVVVVDMESEDDTRGVAESFGARIVTFPRSPVVDAARAFAVDQARCPWILLLDADEMVPSALHVRLSRVVRDDEADVVEVPRANHVFGAPLRGGGWGLHQDRIPRFFRGGSMEITDRIHGFMHPRKGTRVLTLAPDPGLALAHFAYRDVRQFVAKLNRYTDVEALQGSGDSGGSMIGAAVSEFVRRYLRHGGFRDGWRGTYLAIAMAFYRATTRAKEREGGRRRAGEPVEATYDRIRASLLSGRDEATPGDQATRK